MHLYSCRSFDDVTAASHDDAALVFAALAARDAYGPAGYCRSIRLGGRGSYTQTFQAFIGYDLRDGSTQGREYWLVVADLGATEVSTKEVLGLVERNQLLRRTNLTFDEVGESVADRGLREGYGWTWEEIVGIAERRRATHGRIKVPVRLKP